MMSVKMKEVHAVAEARDKGLTAYDFGPNNWVMVRGHDGTQILYRHAFAEYFDDNWAMVFTEHNGFHVYSVGEDGDYYIYSFKQVETKVMSDG